MSSGLLSGCLQNQIKLLAPEIRKIFGSWVGLGWVCTYDFIKVKMNYKKHILLKIKNTLFLDTPCKEVNNYELPLIIYNKYTEIG